MDTDWTFSSRSWLWEEDVTFKNSCSGSDWSREEDKAFETALAIYYDDADRWDKIALAVPGKTVEDIKLHYEALSDEVVAIESGKVPLPCYPSKVNARKKRKKSSRTGLQRGIPWTEEEHRRFLYGLQRFGRGDWKSISRYSVRTKSNSQVASHAQKYFKRLKANEGKRPSINDIRSVHPESLLALEKATTSCMPGNPKEKSTNTGKKKPLRRNPKKALASDRSQLPPGDDMECSTNAGNQLLPAYPKEASTNVRNQLLSIYPKEASITGNELLPGFSMEASTNAGNQVVPGYCKNASTDVRKQLFKRYLKKVPTNVGNQLLPGYPKEGSSNAGSLFLGHPNEASSNAENQLFKGYPKEASTNSGNQLLPGYPKEASTNSGNQLCRGYPKEASTDVGNQLLPGYAKEESSNAGNQLLPGYPKEALTNVGNHLFSGYPKEASIDGGNQLVPGYPKEVSTNARKELFPGYPKEASANVRNQLLPPKPFSGMSVHPFSGHAIAGPGTSASVLPACSMFTPSFAREPIQEPGPSVRMPTFHPPDALIQDGDAPPAASFDIPSGSCSELIDLDMFVFPHFLD